MEITFTNQSTLTALFLLLVMWNKLLIFLYNNLFGMNILSQRRLKGITIVFKLILPMLLENNMGRSCCELMLFLFSISLRREKGNCACIWAGLPIINWQ